MQMPSKIHSTAIIGNKSQLGAGLEVGPYVVIEDGAKIGDGSVIEAHAVIKQWARLDEGSRIGHFSVVGGDPQHLDFNAEKPSFVKIGKNCRLGEGVTIHRSILENQSTRVKNKVFLMGNSHVAHDCILGDNTILANGALLGGHVEIGENVFIGGGTGIHQFVRIGSGAMIGGLAEVSQDVGPNLLVVGRNQACGLNRVGLKRRCISKEDVEQLKKLFRALLSKPVNICEEAKLHLENSKGEISLLAREFLEFYLSGTRGFARQTKI